MHRHRQLLAAASLLSLLVAGGSLTSATALGANDGADGEGLVAARAKQKAVLRMHPQIVQPGKGVKGADSAKSAMTGEFKPSEKGRPVKLQRKTGSGWDTVDKGKQDRKGRVEFTAPYQRSGKISTYRVFAPKDGRLGKVASDGVRTDTWGTADFTDNFTGTALRPEWSHRLQGYSAASSRRCSKASAQAVEVGGGTVRLRVMDDPDRPTVEDVLNGTQMCRYEGNDYDWRLNGHIGTAGHGSQAPTDFLYGYAAARVKFQPLRGQHGSFWLQPTDPESTTGEGSAKETGAEIDVIEWFGKDHPSGGLTSFIWYYPDNGAPGKTGVKVGGFIKKADRFGGKWHKKYHVFSVEWTPKRYVFRIDGKETFRTSKGVSGQREFLILSLLSSDYELEHLGDEDNLPQTMSVDWVRFWER